MGPNRSREHSLIGRGLASLLDTDTIKMRQRAIKGTPIVRIFVKMAMHVHHMRPRAEGIAVRVAINKYFSKYDSSTQTWRLTKNPLQLRARFRGQSTRNYWTLFAVIKGSKPFFSLG